MHPVLFVTRNSNTPCNMSFVTSADMFNLLMSLVYVVLRVYFYESALFIAYPTLLGKQKWHLNLNQHKALIHSCTGL